MWEYEYGKEPINSRLILVRLFQKIGVILIAALIGAAIGGLGYYVVRIVNAPAPVYEAVSEMYVDFAVDKEGNEEFYVYNSAGWNDFVKTDLVLEEAMKYINTSITKESLREAVSAATDSDYRVIKVTVQYESKEAAVEIANAMEKGLLFFATQMRECQQIRVITSAQYAEKILIDTHLVRFTFTIFCVVLVLTTIFVLLQILLDSSFYEPITFERTIQIPVLGMLSKKVIMTPNRKFNSLLQKELEFNFNLWTNKYEKLTALFVDDGTKESRELWKEQVKLVVKSGQMDWQDDVFCIAKDSKVILFVESGKRNREMIYHMISQCSKQEAQVVGAVLISNHDTFLNWYYGRFRKGK